jgi:hypothetical protein
MLEEFIIIKLNIMYIFYNKMFTSLAMNNVKFPYYPNQGDTYNKYDPKTDPHILNFQDNKDLFEKCSTLVKNNNKSLRHENGWKHDSNCNALYKMMKYRFTEQRSYNELYFRVSHHIKELFPETESKTKFETQFPAFTKQHQLINLTCENLEIFDDEYN